MTIINNNAIIYYFVRHVKRLENKILNSFMDNKWIQDFIFDTHFLHMIILINLILIKTFLNLWMFLYSLGVIDFPVKPPSFFNFRLPKYIVLSWYNIRVLRVYYKIAFSKLKFNKINSLIMDNKILYSLRKDLLYDFALNF